MYGDTRVEIKTESVPEDSCYGHRCDLFLTREESHIENGRNCSDKRTDRSDVSG